MKSKIVGFSSESESEKIDQFISAGLNGCFKKPLTVEKIAPFLPPPSSQQAITDSPQEEKGLIDP